MGEVPNRVPDASTRCRLRPQAQLLDDKPGERLVHAHRTRCHASSHNEPAPALFWCVSLVGAGAQCLRLPRHAPVARDPQSTLHRRRHRATQRRAARSLCDATVDCTRGSSGSSVRARLSSSATRSGSTRRPSDAPAHRIRPRAGCDRGRVRPRWLAGHLENLGITALRFLAAGRRRRSRARARRGGGQPARAGRPRQRRAGRDRRAAVGLERPTFDEIATDRGPPLQPRRGTCLTLTIASRVGILRANLAYCESDSVWKRSATPHLSGKSRSGRNEPG